MINHLVVLLAHEAGPCGNPFPTQPQGHFFTGVAMFDSLMPGAEPKRLWLALLVISVIGGVGLLLMMTTGR